jgi:neutral trehalase
MSTPTLSPTTAPSVPYAQHPAADRQTAAPAADDVNRENASRLRGGRLRGLFRMDRKPQPVDVKRKLDEHVERTFAGNDDRTSRRRFRAAAEDARQRPSTHDPMTDRESARAEIESMFEGVSPQFVDQLLDRRENSDIPVYGHAPRYAQAIVLATALAQATGGDAERARDVMNAWNLQAEGDPSRFPATVQADDLAAQCLLAKTELGWDVLTALAPSRFVRLSDTDDERRRMSTALRACAHLLDNLPFGDEAFERPRDLNDALMLAQEIVDCALPEPDADKPRPGTSEVLGFERNVIAARALMGSCSTSPTRKEREAILLFKPQGGERDARNLSMMRHRVNQIFSDTNEKRGFFGRMPTMNQRLMDTLAKRTMSDLVGHLDEALAPPMRWENGLLVRDTDFVPELTDDRVRQALHFTALKTFINRVDHRTRRASIDLKRGEFKDLLDATARRLQITPRELSRHPAWQQGHGECRQLNVDKLRAWMREAGVDPATSDMGKHLRTLENMQLGKASNARGVRELVDTMRPGTSIAFTKRGAQGPNITYWATVAPEALRHKWGHPTVTPLPTGSRIRGRGAAMILSGDEGPDGAHIDIDIGTMDRKSWTLLAGAVGQIHSESPSAASENFWWQVFEYGFHGSHETSEGVKLRIAADTFDEAKALACKVVDALSGVTASEDSDEDLGGWDNLVDEHFDNDHISVHHQTREDTERARIAQTMTVLGVNTPFGGNLAIPKNAWVVGGVNSWWNAFAVQLSRTKGTLTSRIRGADNVSRSENRREQHITLGGLTYPQPSLTPPIHDVTGMGLGAWWIPMKRFVKGLESGEATLYLPPPGSNGTPYQEWVMTELEYIEWQTELWGASSPTPPEHMRNHILPDRPAGARGDLKVVVRRYVKPEAAGELNARFDRIATMNGNPAAGPAIQREMDSAGAKLLDESTWGENMVVSYQYTNQHENVSGMPPIAYQKQHFVGTVERDRQHVLGRTGGRNTLVGTRVPEMYVPDAENQRIFKANKPTRFAPADPNVRQSPMQQQIREIFANFPQEWMPVEPVVMPSHKQIYGQLFHLVQRRSRLYPIGTPIGDALHDYLGTSDSMAVVDCDPRRPAAEIMADFERSRREYAIKNIAQGQPVPDDLDTLGDEFWKDFDVADFFKANFYPPRRPLADRKPEGPINSLKDHVLAFRKINKLDMSEATLRPGSSAIPVPEVADVPSNRFSTPFQWDQLLASAGQLADGDLASVRRTLINKAHIIRTTGIDDNAYATHYTGRQQPETFAIIAGMYADHVGNDDILVEFLPELMGEWYNRMRGAESLMPGTIFNGVAMKPDGKIINGLIDYATPSGSRPEGDLEDTEIADEELARLGINPAFVFGENRDSAAIGTDFSRAQRNPVDGRRELSYSAPLTENAHVLQSERVLVRALRAAGHDEMADMLQKFADQRELAMQETFLAPRTDITLEPKPGTRPPMMVGSYYRLREGELHPLLSAEVANALWAGVVPPQDIEWIVGALDSLTTGDGLMATADVDSHEQWDGLNFWAMHAYKAVEGLIANGHPERAERIALGFVKNARAALVNYGITAEKYNPNGELGRGGEYPVEPNMTMTNETLAYFAWRFKSCKEVYEQPVEQTVAA